MAVPVEDAARASERARRSPLRALLSAMRPLQAPKNGLVLVPLLFSVNIWFSPDDFVGMAAIAMRSVGAAIAFTLLSGAVYLLNDIADVERDRAHPTKRRRPIASGDISVRSAYVAAFIVIATAGVLSLLISTALAIIAVGYLVINIAYTLQLKHLVILDVFSVAAGFVLRAVAGAVAIDGSQLVIDGVEMQIDLVVSPYLYVVTALGASLLAFAKRRAELVAAGDNAAKQRGILGEYTTQFLDVVIFSTASLTVMAYALYTFSFGDVGGNVPGDNSMMLTIPFVAYGIYRYLYLLYVTGDGEAPETILLRDRPTLINIILWLAVASTILLLHTVNGTNGT